jgi:hypothetical protein
MKQSQFLEKLTQEAGLQAKIQAHPVLPRRLAPVTSALGAHTWKILAALSGLLALVVELAEGRWL